MYSLPQRADHTCHSSQVRRGGCSIEAPTVAGCRVKVASFGPPPEPTQTSSERELSCLSLPDMVSNTLLEMNCQGGLHVLIRTEHHSISDGWSNPLMLQEALRFYEGDSSGIHSHLDCWSILPLDGCCWLVQETLRRPFLLLHVTCFAHG